MNTATSPAVRAAGAPAKAALPDNRLFIGDCLPVLAELIDRHGPFADLVYLDPPFNSQRLYNHAFKGAKSTMPQKVAFADTWKWTETTRNRFSAFTKKDAPGSPAAVFLQAMHALLEKRDGATLAYLTYMTPRLARIRAAMKPSASIYLHCDPTASHYLKLAMDAVFGRTNFLNEIVWKRTSSHNKVRRFGPIHDCIFFYSQGSGHTWNAPRFALSEEETEAAFPFEDERGRFRKDPITGPDTRMGESGADWRGYNPTAKGRHWAIPVDARPPEVIGTLATLDWLREQGMIVFSRNGTPTLKRYAHEIETGKRMQDIFLDIPPAMGEESMGYKTQKPLALLRRILEASSNPGDLVLDPFCGCGTTIEAAHELERRFIGVDVARTAAQVIAGRWERAGFGKLRVGDRTPTTVGDWKPRLMNDDPRAEEPAWSCFQFDVIALIPKAEQIEGAIQRTARPGADGGVDGRIHLKHPITEVDDSVVIQVKRKRQPSVADVADTIAAVQNNNAFMGLLLTLNPPTKGMRERAEMESTRKMGGKSYPKVAILTYEEVKAKKYEQAIPYQYAVDPQIGNQVALNLS